MSAMRPGPGGLTRRQATTLLAGLAMAGATGRTHPQTHETRAFSAADLAHAHSLRERGLQDTQAYALVESLVTEVGARGRLAQ